MFALALSRLAADPEHIDRLRARLSAVDPSFVLRRRAVTGQEQLGPGEISPGEAGPGKIRPGEASPSAALKPTPAADVVLLLDDPEHVVTATLAALREAGWCAGIGIGATEGLAPGQLSYESLSGPGLDMALEAAAELVGKKTARQVPIAVRGAVPSQYAEAAQAVLRLVGRIVLGRSAAEWRVLDQLTPGVRGSQGFAAESLGITSQAVSKAAGRAGWLEEWEGRRAAALLLATARQTVKDWS